MLCAGLAEPSSSFLVIICRYVERNPVINVQRTRSYIYRSYLTVNVVKSFCMTRDSMEIIVNDDKRNKMIFLSLNAVVMLLI